jgi:hypothetical protein
MLNQLVLPNQNFKFSKKKEFKKMQEKFRKLKLLLSKKPTAQHTSVAIGEFSGINVFILFSFSRKYLVSKKTQTRKKTWKCLAQII